MTHHGDTEKYNLSGENTEKWIYELFLIETNV